MKNSLHILLPNHEGITYHAILAKHLRTLGHQVDHACDGHTTLKMIDTQNYDLVLVNSRMPDINYIEFLTRIQKNQRDTPIVLISGDATMRTLIETFQLAEVPFLSKSVQSPNIKRRRENGKRLGKLHRSNSNLHETLEEAQACKKLGEQSQCFIGNSPATHQVRERIRQAVEADVDTILITGETGTGKEVVAREIHFQTTSKERPFIAVNCSALPESLVESELFGHVKGAFTGAAKDKAGYFEMANNGTLFLDEIADLALPAQTKLLRILDTRTLRRVGGAQEITVQERVISALNRDPIQIVESGEFRSDLYYRLNVFPIHLEPLRERPEDILPLSEHFLQAYSTKSGRLFDGFSEAAKSSLLQYRYPGMYVS